MLLLVALILAACGSPSSKDGENPVKAAGVLRVGTEGVYSPFSYHDPATNELVGYDVDVAKAVAGRAVVLNLWAYWCGPCADELPALAEYQRRVGSKVTVLTVHQDENETAGLLRLADLGVKLPMLQDGRRLIAAALRVPNVMPATVLLRPDGSVAQVLPRPFTSADEIASAVNAQLGVSG